MRSVAIFFYFISALLSQTPSASITGRVTDATAAVIPGVAVTVKNVDTNITQKATSNEAGDYTILFLNPGRYTLEATSAGFRTFKQAEFQLAVDQALRLDIPMEVGSTTESVTVTDTPPVLNTENGTRGQVITKEEIADIPLDSRSFSDLALLTGGVIPKGDGGDGSYAVNGGRADNTGFLIDGMNNTQRRNTGAVINPPLEGVQEFKMITSGFSAEYGRYAGGVLTVVTKSGSNRFRGSLYEFFRNDAMDATGYFDVQKSKLRRNQFGSTLMGPVWLPKLYNGRDRTFFMVTWESLRLTDGKTQRGIVPRPEMLRGDFSQVADAFGRPLRIVDPLAARAPFANNQIPASRLNPVSLKMAAYYPAPNLTGGANNFISQGNLTQSFNNIGIKVDHNVSERDRLTFSTFWRPNSNFDPVVNSRSPIPLFGLANNTLDLLSYARYLRSLTPSMFLELSASFSRKTNNQLWPYSADKDWAAEVGFLGGTQNPIARGLPQVDASGYIPLGPAYDYPKIWAFNNYQYAATNTWLRGKHAIKFGGDFLRMQYFSRQYGDTRGRVSFLGRFSGDPMADLVLGWPQSTRRQLDAAGPYHLISNYSGFVQDDYKISSSLTLNFGLRYELMKPPKEKFGQWSMFVPSLGKIVIAGRGNIPDFDQRIQATGLSQYITMAADAGLPATIRKADYTDFAPRFGFAWRPFGRKTTVLRGGYGLFYGSSSLYRMDEYSDTYPFSINESYNAVTNNPLILTLSDPYPAARRSVGGVTGTSGQEASLQSQYLQSWNLTLEKEFGRGTVLEVAYAGSKGTHLPRRFDMNQQIRDLDVRAATGAFPRPYPVFTNINIINDGSNSIYNSGAVTVRRRFNKQFFVRGTYTFAKSIDESSNTGGTIQYNFPIAQDSQNLKSERGRSDFDIGHTFAASFILQPNFSRNIVARNWQLAGTSTIYTGPPFTPKVANFNFVNGEASRPDRLAKGSLANPTVDQWFDRTVFPVVPVGSFRFGTSGRNILDGPGTFNVNASLSRRFRIDEERLFQFRLETFNTPNHPNFNLPENRVDIISGGTISRVKNNRNLQLGLRFEF
ncbi:MAG: TonB-dependent receptor [Bryobacterales bacterium]|nr:TonB-dependent receptor [Bryobacterales bacterium]